ncbi:MAG TPA: type I phosphomannose isomerase catalytic subunit [Candidatus Baltobacteraceae bacterium]|nr:type I phosphomannose isomerase catalytic subunit [Candidatus Baltobacteraceae bacterium]
MLGAQALQFEHPVHVWAPAVLDEALDALHQADDWIDRGYWIAGALSYEFGALLHGVAGRTFAPLLVLGAFEAPSNRRSGAGSFAMSAPLARVPLDAYTEAIDGIVAAIREGAVYQVNYTLPFDVGFRGDALGLYEQLASRANAAYSAFVEFGSSAIVSISPELFLRFEPGAIGAKPMKGTAPLERIEELQNEKNRSEHLMIVDLLRNDLQRLGGAVGVDPLFEIERYPTFATMTSTVRARFATMPRFAQAILATFPCGSVTGAPKRAAIEHIARFEREPRGFYTGSIGYLSPERTGWWNVPIRTLQLDLQRGRGRFDAGGGIVFDSNAQSEWDEVRLKSAFLRPAYADFRLIETYAGRSDVHAHLERLRRSAQAFGFDASALSAVPPRDRALTRLTVSSAGALEIDERALQTPPEPVNLCLASARIDSTDPLLRHKTSWRPAYEAAAIEAGRNGCFDAILLNERCEICDGARTNVFAQIGNTLFTPPLACGLLPGVLRSQLVSAGQAVERVLTADDLLRADAVFAGNSARGLLRARIRMTQNTLYPLVLKPKMAPAIWGGDLLVERYGKDGDPAEKIGESWECWDTNAVENGALAGKTLAQLRGELGAALLGDLDPNELFPILTKIIDAQGSLSVQVHPDDSYARRVEHQTNGKTECWYVLDAQAGAQLVMGWNKDTSREEYERRVADGSLGDILNRVDVKAGDAFYIPAGTLHAIGAGITIFETQQASDLTYRIFDWNRVGADGKPRELHVQKAADVLDYRKYATPPLEPLAYAYEGFQRTALIADTHFLVERVQATETAARMQTHGRPVIIMSLDMPLHLACDGGEAELKPYQTALVPAQAQHVEIRTSGGVAHFMNIVPPASTEMLVQRFAHAGVAQPILTAFLEQFGILAAA